MDDDDDDDQEPDINSSDIEMRNNDENEVRLTELSYLVQQNESPFNRKQAQKICDLSCFENLKYIHNLLKNCFTIPRMNGGGDSECVADFEDKWNGFKFLRDEPRSCDYYGTTIYHYAASDNNFDLLKCLVDKYPDGVLCLDSKGMTPLMRAAQRNNYKCAQFLLNSTSCELNGSSFSTYTPLWFGVSNGYTDLVKLLLDFNANPSINDKHKTKKSADILYNLNDSHERREAENITFLFSPIRASIIYSQFKIMNYLLEYGANVNELFSMVGPKNPDRYDPLLNDNFVNSLKFFHRQFGQVIKTNEKSMFLSSLNDFVSDQNVYRQMLTEFVKNVYTNIKLNPDLTHRIDQFLTTFGKSSIETIIHLTRLIESPYQNEIEISEYLRVVNEFMCAIDQFISSENIITNENDENINVPVINNRRDYNDFVRNLIQKPNHHKNLFDFAKYLIGEFYHPKSLKELARFRLRKEIFKSLEGMEGVKYGSGFLKSNRLEMCASGYGLPRNLVNYLLHRPG